MTGIVVDIPPSLTAALDNETARTNRSVSTVVTAALAQYLGTPVHTIFQVSTSGAFDADSARWPSRLPSIFCGFRSRAAGRRRREN
jgi:hypothetical protein